MANSYGFRKLATSSKNPRTRVLNLDHFIPATTGQYKAYSKNHCAAVMLMNVALYYGYGKKDRDETYLKIHKIVGNGPVLFIKNKAKRAFACLGLDIGIRPLKKDMEICQAIDKKQPVGALLIGKNLQMHWVLIVGYRLEDTRYDYLVLDGWNRDGPRLYRPGVQVRTLILGRYSFVR